MPKPNIECLNCGEMFYKKPFRIKKDKIHTCSMKCYGEYLHKRKVKEIEDKFNKPIKVMVQDEEYYFAKPGTIGKNMGVMVLDIIDKDVKEYE